MVQDNFKCFKDMGFVACVSDPCVFVRRDDNDSWVYVTLYVDDMLIGGVSGDSIKKVTDELSSHFSSRHWEKCDLFSALKWDTR